MTGRERREQLLDIGRRLFAERGFEGTSIEEIAAQAGVSKPVVYEHFGGKEGLYAVVVDREVSRFLLVIAPAFIGGDPRSNLEHLIISWLNYVADDPDGFRILLENSGLESTTLRSVMDEIATRFEPWIAKELATCGGDPAIADLYTQMILGAITQTVIWWLDNRKVEKGLLAEHLTNAAWGGVSALAPPPTQRKLHTA
jgi:AcrR family transcriptional regulator